MDKKCTRCGVEWHDGIYPKSFKDDWTISEDPEPTICNACLPKVPRGKK